MNNVFTILDGSIGYVWLDKKNINGIPGVTFYFTRKTVAENLPIEISFVMYNNEIQAICKQDRKVILEEVTIGEAKYIYDNNIIFNKADILDLLNLIPLETLETKTSDTINDMFGIDISSIVDIEGMEFNKLVYIDRLDMDFNISDYFEGYMIIFHDSSTKSFKLGIFVGTLAAYTYREYLDEVNAVGKFKILDLIAVENIKNKTFVTNKNKYRIGLDLTKYKYDVKRSIYPDKHYSRRDISTLSYVIEPGETIEFEHQRNQKNEEYTLLDNPIDPPSEDIFVSDSENYLKNLRYIREEPFEINLTKIVSPIGASNPGQFKIISTAFNIFKEHNDFSHAIVDGSYDNTGLIVKGSFGQVVVSDNKKFTELLRVGSAGSFIKEARVIFKTKFRKIFSVLGEEVFNAQFDYMIAKGNIRILSMESTIAYNDTISTPLPALNINFGFFSNYNEIMSKSNHLEYKNLVLGRELPCKEGRDIIIKKLMGTTAFTNDYIEFNINDILNYPSKKLYSGSLYKTFDSEVDDAYAFYQRTVLRELSGYSLADIPLSITSSDFAAVEPIFNIREEQSECFDDFVYNQEEDIGALGIEISMDQVMAKLKKSMYLYREEDELVASFNLGLTFNKEWYYCGEDFFPAKSIDDDIFTTYLDNEIVSLSKNNSTSNRHIYDKKIFFDSMDYTDQYKEQLHDAFRALVIGDIGISTIYDNPGLTYITSHLLDRNNKRYFSFKEMLAESSSVVFRSTQKKLNNTMIMPDIFKQMMIDDKTGYNQYVKENNVHSFGKMREEYKANYSDLKVGDAYDSAYEIGHSVNLIFNKDMLHKAQDLMQPTGKNIFGIEFSDFTIVDSISVDKVTNYVFGEEIFTFAVIFRIKDIEVFAIAYDYRTKELKFNNAENNVKVIDYTLLIATFDIFLHDFYKKLEGKSRVSLGIYDFDDKSDEVEDVISKDYLLINSASSEKKKKARVFSVKVSSFDATIYLNPDGEQLTEKMFDTLVGKGSILSAELTDKMLTVQKSEQLFEINMSRLELSTSDIIVENGMTIQIYRADLFLPNRFFGNSLSNVNIEVVSSLSSDKPTELLIGEVLNIPFGYSKKIVNSKGDEYNFTLDGTGLKFWKLRKKYSTDTEQVETIDYIMNNKEVEKLYNIDNIECKINFS